ncbi:hypothetical protein SCOR_05625 [Sulfidibacter corallicola]|uniref:Uncharacterized protein n=1 Tax=Sulfidibacter corallicola TaxID=2818388 RepID=A0A8A4TP53_SULCO|nr:hypothetical protein [Sulfidibacter corallicola]QTD51746.1 hypothetical protein J3U87_04690 [Sulfidibacter corallicola]
MNKYLKHRWMILILVVIFGLTAISAILFVNTTNGLTQNKLQQELALKALTEQKREAARLPSKTLEDYPGLLSKGAEWARKNTPVKFGEYQSALLAQRMAVEQANERYSKSSKELIAEELRLRGKQPYHLAYLIIASFLLIITVSVFIYFVQSRTADIEPINPDSSISASNAGDTPKQTGTTSSESRRTTDIGQTICQRLEREIQRLNFHALINLGIGLLVAAFGLWFFWYYGSLTDDTLSLRGIIENINLGDTNLLILFLYVYLPKVAFSVLVEILAFFFLRLYLQHSSDIKNFQHELTNMQARLHALEVAQKDQNHAVLNVALKDMATTERNYVLSKGQTTVDLEKAKQNKELVDKIIEMGQKFLLMKSKGK